MFESTTLQKRVQAFLDLIAWSEGTSIHPLTKCNGYDVIVTGEQGPEVFHDFTCHPFTLGRKPVRVRDNPTLLESTASGRYQISLPTWTDLVHRYHIGSFTTQNQDRAALALLVDCKALDHIYRQELELAFEAASLEWASFPGNLYGQGAHDTATLIDNYYRLLDNPSD